MEPLKLYDYLTLAREKLFDEVRPLSDAEYRREFPIGLKSLARTLTHTMICEWAYMQRIRRIETPPYEEWPIQDEKPPAFSELETVWKSQAVETRATIEKLEDWTTRFEFQTVNRQGHKIAVTTSNGDFFAQLLVHEVHHRAQAMNMLTQLGRPTQDLDFSGLMFERKAL